MEELRGNVFAELNAVKEKLEAVKAMIKSNIRSEDNAEGFLLGTAEEYERCLSV